MTESLALALAALTDDATAPVDLGMLPYTRFLGLTGAQAGGALTVTMPFSPALVGSPSPPRLHGGTVGALLEATAAFTLCLALMRRGQMIRSLPKSISLTVEYLRPGREADTHAVARITRLGRRIANLRAEAWQQDRDRLIATAHINLLIDSIGDAPHWIDDDGGPGTVI